ncbi:MAG: type III pantothenate kinase [Planctomycetota bacterium]|nr:type III pantothenate kinase [Planctomycetota bacterium]
MAADTYLVVISVGNTRTHISSVEGDACGAPTCFTNDDLAGAVSRVVELWGRKTAGASGSILMADVNEPVASRLASAIQDQLSEDVYRIGQDIPIPMMVRLDPETITGTDRLLNALAAWESVKQACIIVDTGTAVTVDFVDGEGTFHGGAIAPGAAMQLRALHEYTDALPEVEFRSPQSGAFGKSTAEAMILGVFAGIRGLAWRLVEQYAAEYGAYPMVIATGGDAEAIFGEDELIDRVVPNLTLIGIAACAKHALAGEAPDTSEDASSN